jgi:zinc protease
VPCLAPAVEGILIFVKNMKNRPRLLALMVAAVPLLIASACVNLPQKQAAADSVLSRTLDNGLQVVIVRDPLAPVVTQQVTYLVGANQSPQGFPGMAHAVEHMMFRGSPGLSGDQLAGLSAQLGGDMDAYTASTTTTYYFTVPANDLDVILKIEALRMAGVDNSQPDWEKERGAIEQEVARDNSSPMYVLQAKAREQIFAGTPYSDTGLGTKESFDQTTGEMLKTFHDTWYAPNNALLVIAGDVDPVEVFSKVRDLFGSIPRKTIAEKAPIVLQPVVPQTITSTTDQAYGFVSYTFRTPGYRSPECAAVQILAQVLNSPRSAISSLAYEGKALDAGFFQQTFPDTGYATAWAAFPQGGDPTTLQEELKAAVLRAKSEIPEDLIEAERKRIVLESELREDSVSGLAQLWTDAIALEGFKSPDEGVSTLRNVDTKAVSESAIQLLDFDHSITLVLTPSPSGQPTQGGQVFGSPESFASAPDKPVSLPLWSAHALAKLPHPVPLFKPTALTLANGLRLIVQPLATGGAISLRGRVRTNEDLQAPPGKEGVSDMLNTLFDWGPRGMSRSDFEAAMDSIGAEYSTGTGFSLQVMPESFDKGVELLSRDILDPALPEDAFLSQKSLQSQQAGGRMRSPAYQFGLAVQKALAPQGDLSLRRPTPESIKSLSMDDVRAYHRAVVRPDETTIVVMGKVDPTMVRSVIAKYFGVWRASGPKPDLNYQPVPASQPQDVFIPDEVRQQDEVVIAETLPLTYEDSDHYAIALGNMFLGGDSFASPLYRELRVKRGLVYGVGSSADFSRTRGTFSLNFGAYPEKVLEAKQIALQVIKAIVSSPMSDADLRLAKAQALRQIELTNQTASDIATHWLGYSEEGLSLDRLYQVARAYEGLTATQVQAAFARYIDLGRLSTFILGQQVK